MFQYSFATKIVGSGRGPGQRIGLRNQTALLRDSQGTQAILQHSTGSANGKQPGSNLPLACSKISKFFGGRCVRVRDFEGLNQVIGQT